MTSGETRITLPIIPPSLNGIWRGKGNGQVYRADKYTDWITAAGLIVNRQTADRINSPIYTAPVSVTVAMKRPRANADLDNRLKPLGDLLERHHVLSDDKLIHMWIASWAELEGDDEVDMIVRPLSA
jgi:Holliday junction resolvase RusA-like endonuclease